jgi:hypothetical protein
MPCFVCLGDRIDPATGRLCPRCKGDGADPDNLAARITALEQRLAAHERAVAALSDVPVLRVL